LLEKEEKKIRENFGRRGMEESRRIYQFEVLFSMH
jgi:hypothetical protein